MNTKVLLLSLLLLLGYNRVNSQNKSLSREMFLEAESYFLYDEFKEALPLYIQLSILYPKNDNINYRLGRCYLNIPYEREKAISYLETASQNINPEYKGDNLKETAAPPDVMYYLGDAYRINNQLEKAIVQYTRFKKLSNPAIFDHDLINDQIRACENAKILEKKPVKISFTNLGEVINTRFSENNAVISGDESVLVFSAQLQFYPAVFFSKNINGKWTAPVNINADLIVDEDCYPVGLSYNGKELLLYRSNEFLGDLYVSRFTDGKWSKIKKLNNNINTKYWESHACFSKDGKKLYFTSNRKGTHGGLDIFVSNRKETDQDDWGIAINLGTTVNSPYNEETPFISSDDRKLYFSSVGHNGMGGYDIFLSNYNNENGSWSIPQNLGYPLNTTDNDLFFQPVREGNEGYISLFNKDSYGRNDIYKVKITVTSTQLAAINSNLKEPEITALPSEIDNITIQDQEPESGDQDIAQLTKSQDVSVTNSSLIQENNNQDTISADTSNETESNQINSISDSTFNPDLDTTLNPGQKQAWHKLLFGGIGILAVFVFFILFLYLKSRKRKK